MNKTIHRPEYKVLLKWLISKREQKGISARKLSAQLNSAHSWVSKIESGERRLDLLEYVKICKVLEIDPCEGIQQIINPLPKL